MKVHVLKIWDITFSLKNHINDNFFAHSQLSALTVLFTTSQSGHHGLDNHIKITPPRRQNISKTFYNITTQKKEILSVDLLD